MEKPKNYNTQTERTLAQTYSPMLYWPRSSNNQGLLQYLYFSGVSKMPRVKKATISKSIKKVAKRVTKIAQDESTALHQTLVGSLVKLDKHWNKQLTSAKKQLDTQKTQLKKAQDKLKDLKNKRAEKASIAKTKANSTSAKQLEKATMMFKAHQDKTQDIKLLVSQSREKTQVAKLTLKKYVTLNKTVETSEKDWLKQIKETTTATKKVTTNAVKKTKSVAEKATVAKKEKLKPVKAVKTKSTNKTQITKVADQKSAVTTKPRRPRKAKVVAVDTTTSELELDNNAKNLAELNTEISEAMDVDISEFDAVE